MQLGVGVTCTSACPPFLVLTSLLLASGVAAQEIPRRLSEPVDSWSDPNPGVRYLHRTYDEPRIAVHALVIDLNHEGVRVVATARSERWGTVSGFAREHHAAAAINGGFWGMWQRPSGISAGGGELWDNAEASPDFGHFAVTRAGRAIVRRPGEGEDERSLSRVTEAVSGRPVLVTRGRVDQEGLDAFEMSNFRQPRTAIGVSRDGRTVIMLVVDGRQSHSRGFTLYQLARQLIELGAHRAINLDGGGSSAMYVRQAGGIVSSPCRGRWAEMLGLDETDTRRVRDRGGVREVYVRGTEREVMTQLAVIAPAPAHTVAVQASGSSLGDGLAFERPRLSAPRSQPIELGQLRELLYPALYVGGPIVLGLLLVWAGRRFSSRRAGLRARSVRARTRAGSSRM